MLYYLDTVIVIYAVEGNPADQQRALSHISLLEQAGHQFAISELTHTECLVPVLGAGGGQRLSDFFRFFHGPNLRTLSLTTTMHGRAGGYPGWSLLPGRPARAAEAVRIARRTPFSRCNRVRLRRVSDQRQSIG